MQTTECQKLVTDRSLYGSIKGHVSGSQNTIFFFFEKLHVTTDPETEHKPVNMKLIKIDFFFLFFWEGASA